MQWRMRRLTANEHPQLWHLSVSESNGHYHTACGLRFGIPGSAYRSEVPAGACLRCLRYEEDVQIKSSHAYDHGARSRVL